MKKSWIFLIALLSAAGCTSPQKRFSRVGTPAYRAEVTRMMHSHDRDFNYCAYRARNAAIPDVIGNVTMGIHVEKTGLVSKIYVKESTVQTPEVGKCLADTIRGLTFPAFDENTTYNITYPFVFHPG